jgi:adenylate kinase family enzyme
MRRIVIFGNSGSGKSTLAKKLSFDENLAHLDLDTVAWQATQIPIREDLAKSKKIIDKFLDENEGWLIEGCYSDLIAFVLHQATEVHFLNPDVEACIENCKNRPWEPHKYASLEKQNENLNLLIQWVRKYETRNDEFSLKSHRKLFDEFQGKKIEYRSSNKNV